jgi:hypothetical protein
MMIDVSREQTIDAERERWIHRAKLANAEHERKKRGAANVVEFARWAGIPELQSLNASGLTDWPQWLRFRQRRRDCGGLYPFGLTSLDQPLGLRSKEPRVRLYISEPYAQRWLGCEDQYLAEVRNVCKAENLRALHWLGGAFWNPPNVMLTTLFWSPRTNWGPPSRDARVVEIPS